MRFEEFFGAVHLLPHTIFCEEEGGKKFSHQRRMSLLYVTEDALTTLYDLLDCTLLVILV